MLIPTDRPFRGSAALAAGALSSAVLYGPRYRRLFPDVHIAAGVQPDLMTWSLAAHELVAPCGALAGYSAAEVHGASCAPQGAPAEIVLRFGYRRKSEPMLVVHRDTVDAAEITTVDGLLVTTPQRTATDLARWAPSLTEAVVAVDALCHACELAPAEAVRARPGARGAARLPEVIALADPLAESPMETRIRLAIVLAGLPRPVLQHPVGPYRLDMSYPELRLGIEYDGREHLTPERALHDLTRQAYLTRDGWHLLRFPAAEVFRPAQLAARVRAERAERPLVLSRS
ncbi:endonuclease domain-containing protein [Pseudonocardia sp. GCM10023141]|uniref:endonuclease domain-containing protein n=1 Tax=Pseudonocardia sp. GCM10023141 TaxID=3252653 RepID=UPI003607ABE0